MGVLDLEIYDKVVEEGKKAVQSLKNNDLLRFEIFAENGWNLFPEPKENWNQAYNYAKSMFNGFFKHKQYEKAKVWLNRMIENNNNSHHSDDEVWFYVGKYHFETGNYKEAYDKWKAVVQDAGYRYFEDEDPKYLDFYKNPQKYMK